MTKDIVVMERKQDTGIVRFLKTVFFVEILQGMKLTLKTMFTKPVTRQYPKEKRPAMTGFRGLHALVRNPETKQAKCVGCGLCAAICPSHCITIYTSEGEKHEKVVDRYEIDVLRCLYCALCVEACPFGAVVLTEHYEYAGYNKADFKMTKEKLLENWDKYMTGDKGTEYFKRFWGPRADDFKTPENQAVFRGRSQTKVDLNNAE